MIKGDPRTKLCTGQEINQFKSEVRRGRTFSEKMKLRGYLMCFEYIEGFA